jgi:hypothetical protein
MAIEIIDVGSAPNDGQGDPIRTAYVKCNNNFGELFNRQQNPPGNLTGSEGDVAGMYAFDSNYWYYCFQNYDANAANTVIWQQVSSESPTQLISGNSNISVSNTSITMGVNGVGNVVEILANGAIFTNTTVTGSAIFSGNIQSQHIIPSGNLQYDLGAPDAQWRSLYLSGNTIYLGTAEISSNATSVTLTSGSGASFSVSGTSSSGNLSADNVSANSITANTFVGDGSGLTNVTAFANVAVTQVANGLSVIGINQINGNITAQVDGVANIAVISPQGIETSQSVTVGNALLVSGNTTIASLSTTNISASGTAVISGNLSAQNINTAVVSATGNVTGSNISATGSIAAVGNITGANIATTGVLLTKDISITGNSSISGFSTIGGLITAASANITDATDASSTATGALRVLGGIGVGGTVYTTNLTVSGTANITNLPASSITSGVISSARISGAYAGITSVGNLTSLTVTGTASVGNITTGGVVTATGNITGGNINTSGNVASNFFIGNGSLLTGIVASSNRIVNGTSEINIGTSNGNANITINGVGNVVIVSSNALTVNGNVSAAGNVIASNLVTSGSVSATGNISGSNISGSNMSVSGSVSLASITKVGANGVGNIGSSSSVFNTVFAKATSAQYADLAEKYTADADYAPGTVVMFGGDAEVTICDESADHRVAGVISENPSYIMNAGLEAEHVAVVALQGRVPCRVLGPIRKGDIMVSAGSGAAQTQNDARAGTIIGKALENFDGEYGTIEIVVGRS